MSETKLVLCLMVRNEATIVERCLRAALPLVDGYALSVNNTTDDTVEIAQRVADEMRVPGTIIESPWRNFGSNRSKSVADTKAWVVAQGWDPASTYAVLVDADHVLHARDTFRRELLTGPHYEIDTNDGRLRNPGTRLVRLSHEWQCIGVTHEYWASSPNTPAEFFADLWIEDLCDGGSKDDKLPRDVKLLLQGLMDEPTNGRYMFYLAESYFHLHQWDAAVRWYENRIEAGGWEEETWYARYKQGVALLQKGATELGAGTLLQAFEARPGRAEPLAALAAHYRERSKNQLAYMFATRGAEIPDTADRLFVELDARHRCVDEISITGFYCGDKARKAGFEACDQLLGEHGHPDQKYHHWACNESFYLQPLPCGRSGAFPLPAHLRLNDGLPYYGTNPTIIDGNAPGEQIVHVRLVNFEHTGGRNYRAFDPRNIFRTRGAVMRWDAHKGEALSEAIEVTQLMPLDWPTDVQITGLEDQRWVWHEGRVWFTATCCQVPGAGGQPLVVFGLMNEALDAVERVMRLDYANARSIEKNWVPWSFDGEMLLIYSYEPFVVLKVDTDTGHCTEIQRWMPPKRFARWRGSSSPVMMPEWSGLWLLLIHEVAYRATDNVYAHRWVVIRAETMRIVAYSKPFVFDHVGVEYCGGLQVHDSHLIATYGAEDKEPRWAEYRATDVLSSLEWVG